MMNLKFKKLNQDGSYELIDTPVNGNLLTYFNSINIRNHTEKDKPYRYAATSEALLLLQHMVDESQEVLRRLAKDTVTGSRDSKEVPGA